METTINSEEMAHTIGKLMYVMDAMRRGREDSALLYEFSHAGQLMGLLQGYLSCMSDLPVSAREARAAHAFDALKRKSLEWQQMGIEEGWWMASEITHLWADGDA